MAVNSNGQAIIFCSCGFYLLLSSFFPCLISAVRDWMPTILPHMMWPQCKFTMHVWNVLHAARWKYRMQKLRQKSPSAHHRTSLSGYILATKVCINNRKKADKRQYLLHMSSQYAELRPINGWQLLASLGHPANFNGFRDLAALLHQCCSTDVNTTLQDVWLSPGLVHHI